MDFLSLSPILDAAEGDLSQEGNGNATARLLLLPRFRQVAKIYTKDPALWEKNLLNLKEICQQISPTDFPEIVFPTALIQYRCRTVGYLMPFLEGQTLEQALACRDRSVEAGLALFAQLAGVIARLPEKVHIGDLHPKNVLVGEDGQVHLIDLDGFSLEGGYPMTCPLYFESLPPGALPEEKYFQPDHCVKIGKNTDLYCLLELFFTWLFQGVNPFRFSKKRFSLFCDYLRQKGLPEPAVAAVVQVRQPGDNALPPDFFPCFAPVADALSYPDYLAAMGLKKEEEGYCRYIDQIIEENRNGTKVL